VSRRACVIGHPVAHSRSPLILGYWLREHKIDGDYVREDVPLATIGSFLDRLGETYVGANVTIPHKEAAFAKLKHPDPVARALGAANTLWFENGALSGTNTDVHGFLAHLDASLSGWERRTATALVLGAGGASRSVVYALLERGVGRVTIVNRTRARAEALAERFGPRVTVADLASISKALATADLLVNTTSLGMKGQPPLELDLAPLKKTAAVYDIVYVPLETPLLAAARARGNPVIDGLGMLLHQAVPGFERWFGVRPIVTPALRLLLLADLGEKERP
jgi:shikimate dehydrogenase